ncbi:AAA family ATPase [Treponema primitia]|uniref:AAA family ATPase n=1 Tax=Treponema primitia TaxID=88058 RepID=UPI0039803F52
MPQYNILNADHYLLEISLRRETVPSFKEYPFSLPIIRHFRTLSPHPKITFIVGENGSGKSTLLEAIAVAWGFNPEGGTKNFNFQTRASHSPLHKHLKLLKGLTPKDGFFFRAESFFNLATEIENLDKGAGPRLIIDSYGGIYLHNQSHGESFFATIQNRFGGNGLYLLDEPEAALSPTRQMSMLLLLHQLVQKHSQFIIATHSPILLAYPDADIYQIGDKGLCKIAYEDTSNYIVTKAFINNPRGMIARLFEGD